jgi:hypothetical protein
MNASGYRLRAKGNKTAVCTNCSSIIGLDISQTEKIRTDQFASEYCILCGTDISNGDNATHRPYPEQIAVLLDVHFDSYGGRFNGVVPLINSPVERESHGTHTIGKSVPTGHDPVLVLVYSTETDVVSALRSFIDTIETLGNLRGTIKEIHDETDELVQYEFQFFAVQ